MRYAGIIKNDISAAPGVCLTLFTQGCPHRCIGCHNPETWDFNGGREFTQDTLNLILESINQNGFIRNFCIMGGEPLCDENLFITELVCREVKMTYPEIKIYIWTGYTYEELSANPNNRLVSIFSMIEGLIDGRFEIENRDITLKMRGSTNQRIINMPATLSSGEITLMEFSDEQT